MSTLTLDLVEEILCRLPVKSLIQFQCVCKSWKSLISNDPKFSKKHLHISLNCPRQSRHHLIVNSTAYYWNSPISSIFNTLSNAIIKQTNLTYPSTLNKVSFKVIGSCHGIICCSIPYYVIFWNPSIQKLKISPNLYAYTFNTTMYGFGYDFYNDNYKVVAICYDSGKTKVNVHIMGTNYWRRIQEFPCGVVPVGEESGKFVAGTVNWLASEINGVEFNSSSLCIVSLDLGNESYRKISQPDYGDVNVLVSLTLGELRDCLCIFAHGKSFVDVWLMKECGKNESWSKLFTIPFIEDIGCSKVTYIYEDEQVLLVSRAKDMLKPKLVVYDSKRHTFKLPEIANINNRMVPTVYVESLITTCS